jgi:hypothetical protein
MADSALVVGGLIAIVAVSLLLGVRLLTKPKEPKPVMNDSAIPKKVRMGSQLAFEITVVSPDTNAQVIIAKGSKRKWRKMTRFTVKYGEEFRTYLLNISGLWADNKLHYNRDIEVPISPQGEYIFEDWNEQLLVDNVLDQFGYVLGNLTKFQFTRNVWTGIIIMATIGIGFGFTLAPDYLSNTIIHWVS